MWTPIRTVFDRLSMLGVGLRGLLAGIRLFFDPSRLDMVIALERALDRDEGPERIAELRAKPDARRAFEEKHRLVVDVNALVQLPEGTLGRAFGDFLRQNELDPASLPTLPDDDDAEFASAHLYETHDVWH